MGLGASFSEIPVLAYISETISVELRGRLFSLTKIGYGIGALFVFFCNIYLHWRTLASICILAPIFSIGYLLMVSVFDCLRNTYKFQDGRLIYVILACWLILLGVPPPTHLLNYRLGVWRGE